MDADVFEARTGLHNEYEMFLCCIDETPQPLAKVRERLKAMRVGMGYRGDVWRFAQHVRKAVAEGVAVMTDDNLIKEPDDLMSESMFYCEGDKVMHKEIDMGTALAQINENRRFGDD